MTLNPVERFVKDVLERATKTAAQAALLALGADALRSGLDALTVHWQPVAGFAAGGFILSVLTSLASQPIGDKASASVLSGPALPPPAPPEAPDAVSTAQSIFPQ